MVSIFPASSMDAVLRFFTKWIPSASDERAIDAWFDHSTKAPKPMVIGTGYRLSVLNRPVPKPIPEPDPPRPPPHPLPNPPIPPEPPRPRPINRRSHRNAKRIAETLGERFYDPGPIDSFIDQRTRLRGNVAE